MDISLIQQNCGFLFVPQLIVSVLVVMFIVSYIVAWRKHEISPDEREWNQVLDPLGNIAVSLGLFGSVIGFIAAFGGFQKGIQVDVLTKGLATAYYTTGVGIFTSLMATVGCYFLNFPTKNRK